MLRFIIYLLYLFLAINRCICYNKNERHHHDKLKELNFEKIKSKNNDHIAEKRQAFDSMMDDKEPVVQIDVASFIKPDEYGVGDNFIYGSDMKTGGTNLMDYNDLESLSEFNSVEDVVKRSNKLPYYRDPSTDKPVDLGPKPFPYKDTINSRHLNLDPLTLHGSGSGRMAEYKGSKSSASSYGSPLFSIDSNDLHKPKKKCALNHVKFPFFSHNKNETSKHKKTKKRRIFCLNCLKKKDEEKKNKKLSKNTPDKEAGSKKEDLSVLNKSSIIDRKDKVEEPKSLQERRQKREEWHTERERKIKEIEALEQRVDSFKITSEKN